MNQQSEPAPVACSLNATGLALRAGRWHALAERAAGEVTRTDTGLRLAFSAGEGVAAELAELAALERDCCAFATWSVAEAGDQVVLEVSAQGEEGVGAVQAMFGTLPARETRA
jgi:hypothetical protein